MQILINMSSIVTNYLFLPTDQLSNKIYYNKEDNSRLFVLQPRLDPAKSTNQSNKLRFLRTHSFLNYSKFYLATLYT